MPGLQLMIPIIQRSLGGGYPGRRARHAIGRIFPLNRLGIPGSRVSWPAGDPHPHCPANPSSSRSSNLPIPTGVLQRTTVGWQERCGG